MLNMIGKSFQLKEIDVGEFATAKVGVMKFKVRSFDAAGLGRVSVLSESGLFGLMKMDTLIVNPFEKDMALFSYDRIYAMGNDTILLELYDTRINKEASLKELEQVVKKYSDIPKQPAESKWYDSIRLSVSLKKKGKKNVTPRFDKLTSEYLYSVIKLIKNEPECDVEKKKKVASKYTEGLLSHGALVRTSLLRQREKHIHKSYFVISFLGQVKYRLLTKLKERLEKASLSVYNYFRKVIGYFIRLPSVNEFYLRNSIQTFLRLGMLFFCIKVLLGFLVKYY